MMAREYTFYITNYCPHNCEYCSSSSVGVVRKAEFIDKSVIYHFLADTNKQFDIINVSGGEPLHHPEIGDILELCKRHAKLVVLHTNLIRAIMFNANVISGIQVEANLTLQSNTEKLHLLKRIEQGREAKRIKIHHSHNYDNKCDGDCGHEIMMPDGSIRSAPCRKEK